MNAALLVGGPAVLLAILAWAADRFMPVPSLEQSNANGPQPNRMTTTQGPSARTVPRIQTVEVIRQALERAENAQEFAPLADALTRLGIKRSKSMTEDSFPDPNVHRYPASDAIELTRHRIVFDSDGKAQFEPRS